MDGNQSLDDSVVNCRVVVVSRHPSVIKCGNMETRQSGRVAADCKSVLSGE